MAWHLFRLGRWSFVHRRIVASIWAAIFTGTIVGMLTLSGTTSDSFELSGLESTDAFTLIDQRSPGAAADGASAKLVFEAPAGTRIDDADNREAIAGALEAATTPHVVSIAEPFSSGTVSEDGTTAYADVDYDKPAEELTTVDLDALTKAQQIADDAGLTAAIGGDGPEEEAVPIGELVGIVVAFFVLAITFGSLVAAGMPLLTAVIGVGIGVTSIGIISGFVELGSTTPALGIMLGLAVGIDYALFIMSRFQHEIRLGRSPEEAAGRAVGTAGSAVIFAGLTVVVALAGLSVCGVGFLTQLGLAGAGMVAISVVIALTLLPALLGFAGKRVRSGRLKFLKNRDPEGDDEHRTNGRRWVELVSRFRVPALVVGVLGAAVMALPVFSIQLALPGAASDPAGSGTRVAYDLVSEKFGEGVNGPLVVVIDTAKAKDPIAAVDTAVGELDSITTGIASIQSPLADGSAASRQALQQQIDAVGLATATVVPTSGPTDEETKKLVDTLRTTLADLPAETGARALVTGQTAVDVDIAAELNSVFPLYLAVVVGLAFILLILVFRSILVPLKAALGFLLSVGVSLGATVAVFQWGWLNQLLGLDTTSPVLFLLPLLLTGILFGLAMDYEVFLVTRMREAYIHGTPARDAVIEGFQHSARVVVAAAVIMVGVFGGFALVDDVTLKTIGFALAVGVIADAFLVRMMIVPAVMLIVGERMWWIPAWLDRLIPDLDIEGEQLTRRLDGAAPVTPR